MRPTVGSAEVPPGSEIERQLPGAYFHDSYQALLPAQAAGSSALELSLQTFLKTPRWIDFLMRLRNRVVGLVGLKNLGSFNHLDPGKPASAYRVGDRVGIFSLRYLTDNEVILADSDKHLDVQVSVCKLMRDEAVRVNISTVVHVHNRLGKLYMFFVAPAHKVIAPATLRGLLRRGAGSGI